MEDPRVVVLDLSYQALGAGQDCHAVVGACLQRVIGGDHVGWWWHEPEQRQIRMWGDPPDHIPPPDSLALAVREHPLVRHFRHSGADFLPRRVSDCLPPRELRRSSFYVDHMLPLASAYQLMIALTRPGEDTAGAGWTITRSVTDFTDEQVRLAAVLAPMIRLLDRRLDLCQPAERDEARLRARLTPREADLITLLAAGASADQMAHLRRLSVRTVRKHLQNTYDKLGVHDRVHAINRARRLGVIP
ncbi:response regulator transcription factor [Nonomuraea endophytica]|uniref:DNA-binding CsgD family transcriptional regulator n=1 Tax=Nonomuraea endophytica TaxID=714136 RepID=A0A7W8EK90_9ACTN|nr:LuxR C-terminal-related transcriptional regulator [Nonomuraea endophytica]MBB5083980.1 DNA-binding CsgD family transcriptional regulator [Nonomuraea endophytica]